MGISINMRINHVLDEIFARKSNIVVMRALKNYTTGISGREVSRNIDLAANNTLNTLTYLENLGIVNRIRGGREHLFTLNRKNYLVSQVVLPILQSEEEYVLSIRKVIKSKLKGKVVSALIYGSVARKEETIKSDLDLCLVHDKSRKLHLIEEAMQSLRSLMYKKYGINISPLYFSRAEFIKKAKYGKPPVAQIIEEGECVVGETIKGLLNAKRG